MQASLLPQTCSAAAIIQARRGGLEKYPKAGSRDQAQYCDSSKNKSTVENLSPTSRTSVSAIRMATATPSRGTTRDRLVICVTATIIRYETGDGHWNRPDQDTRIMVPIRGSHHSLL